MAVIDYYFSCASPWSWLGHERLVALAGRHGASVNAKPVDYRRVFPATGGVPLKARAAQRQAYRLVELPRWRDHLGIALNPQPRHFPVDADPAARLVIAADAVEGASAALRHPAFWLLYVACGAFSVGLFIPFVHIAPFARDHGLSEQTGVFLMGLIGVGSVLGRFALAGVGDRLPRRRLLSLVYLVSGLMFLFWWLSAHWLALAAFALIFGTCYGLFVALQPPITMDYFGARNVSGLIGLLCTSAALSNLVGPTFAGYAFDASGSYARPIAVSAGLMAVALACALALPPRG